MATQTHTVVGFGEVQGNYPQYKWYVECSCGFQARLARKELVEGQYAAHLRAHGLDDKFTVPEKAVIAIPEVEPVVVKEEQPQPQEKKENGTGPSRLQQLLDAKRQGQTPQV